MLQKRMASTSPPRAPQAQRYLGKSIPAERRPWVLAASILVSAMGFIDGTVLSIATPAIREALDATLVQALWFSSAYMLPVAALILVGGAAGDRFGTDRVILVGLAVFMVASVATALAWNAEVFIVSRVAKGAGAALIIPGALAMIARAYPPDIRGRAIGQWAAASAITTALGPILGGALLEAGSDNAWRLIFAINLPLGALAWWMLVAKVGRVPAKDGVALDVPGAVLSVVALGAGAFALSRLGEADARVAPFAITAVIAAALFLAWEARTPHAMVPLSLFRHRTFTAANLLTFLLYFALSAVLFYLPMTVISAWEISTLSAAAAFAPLPVFIGALSTRVGVWSDKIGPRPLISVGAALTGVAFLAMALTLPLRAYWSVVLPLNCLLALGMALVVSPLSTSVMGAVDEELSGLASGINNAVSRAAGLVAIPAMGGLAAIVYARASGTESFGELGGDAAHRAATDAGFQAMLLILAALSALASLTARWGIAPKERA
ncbi:MAG: MFS transporter [Pseudomonadota bacterium]